MMPVMDGFEATIAIRESGQEYAEVPIIALTASCYPEDIERCKRVGFNEIVNKPIRKDQLLRVIQHVPSLS